MNALIVTLAGLSPLLQGQGQAPNPQASVRATLEAALATRSSTDVALTVAIGSKGAIHSGGAGSLMLGGPRPTVGDTGMHSAGSAELVTQILVLDLVALGELELDVPIARLVPALADLDERVLLSSALEGRSGLRDVRDVLHVRRGGERETATIGEAAGWIARMRLLGDRSTASDAVLLAAVLEHRAGRPFAELARAELFVPLEMKSTVYASKPAPEHALGYVTVGPRDVRPAAPPGRLYAIEGLYTTAPDMLRLTHELIEPRTLHPELFETLVDVAERWSGLRAVGGRTAAGRPTIVLSDRPGSVALALLPEQGWGVTCLDALNPGRARESVDASLNRIDEVFDGPRRPQSWLGIGSGFGGKYGGRTSSVRSYDTSGLAGRYDLPELGLELSVTSDGQDRFRLTLEGWPELRSTGTVSRSLPAKGDDALVFTGLGGSLVARFEVRVDDRRLIPAGLTLQGDSQRHGTLDRLILERQ